MTDPVAGQARARSRTRRVAFITLVALAVVALAALALSVPVQERVGQAVLALGNRVKPAEPVRGNQAARPAVEAKSKPATPGRPIAEDEPAFWSDVEIYHAGAGRSRPVVVVKRGKQPTSGNFQDLYQGLLAREIVRQGVMLSARAELGAIIRDVPVGDPPEAGKPDAAFRVGSRFRLFYKSTASDPPVGRITLVAGTGPDRRVIVTREFDCRMVIAPSFGLLVERVEDFSRGEFRTAFEELGLKRTDPPPPVPADGAGVPDDLEARLSRLVETEQFALIRDLHAAVRTRGETPPLLHALSRAYAHLGSLCETQWTPDSLAFHARALLYAQRAYVRDRGSAASHRARAYAEAFAGIFDRALEDLESANRLDGAKGAPYWVKAVRAHCHSDSDALAAAVNERPDDILLLYLRFLTKYHSSGVRYENWEYKICREEIIAAGRALLKKIPDCYRVHEDMGDVEGVSNLHTTTTVPFELFGTAVPRRLAALPGLPAEVAALVSAGGPPDEIELRRRLASAARNDPADLTWGVLARQFREIRFVQVCRRLHFEAYSLAVSPREFATDALPLLTGHPYRAYVECFADSLDSAQMIERYKSIDFSDVVRRADIMLSPLRRLDPALGDQWTSLDFAHISSGTVPGQEERTKSGAPKDMAHAAHNLLRYSPDSPLGRGVLIETNWAEAEPHAAAWEKEHGGDAFVLAQLGFHWLGAGRLDDAARLFEQALAHSHDGWIFKGLTETYRQSGAIDRWIESVNDFLKREDLALDHAHALEDLAKHLMEKKEYKKARPFAELAAQSWAGWAMISAAHCAEEMADWEAAERWISRTSERYPLYWLDWFFWCKRTGHGDAKAAAALVKGQLDANRSLASADEALEVAIVFFLAQQPREARPILDRLYNDQHAPIQGALLALAGDLDGDSAARDAALRNVRDEPKSKAPRASELFGIIGAWVAAPDKTELDLNRVNKLLDGMPVALRANACVLAGVFLDRHGKPDVALDYLKRANVKECHRWLRLIAIDTLRARKIEPAAFPW